MLAHQALPVTCTAGQVGSKQDLDVPSACRLPAEPEQGLSMHGLKTGGVCGVLGPSAVLACAHPTVTCRLSVFAWGAGKGPAWESCLAPAGPPAGMSPIPDSTDHSKSRHRCHSTKGLKPTREHVGVAAVHVQCCSQQLPCCLRRTINEGPTAAACWLLKL